jgi:hypothetical protein
MAGINITDSVSWIVAGWVHSFTVELLLKHLSPEAPEELKKALRTDQESGLNLVSLQPLGSECASEMLETLKRITVLLKSGEEPFGTPSVLPAYLDRLQELMQMLEGFLGQTKELG